MTIRPAHSTRRMTLKDVASELGVSTAAVSYAFTRPSRLSSRLRTKVLETARRLGYSGPDPVARNLRRGQTGVVGVVFRDALAEGLATPSTLIFLRGVAGVVESANLCLLLIPGSLRKVKNLKLVSAAAVDGMIVYSLDDRDPLVNAVLGRRVPTVLVDSEAIPNASTVGIDNENGARSAAEHLIGLGHRRIGIIVSGPKIDAQGGFMTLDALRAATSSDFRARLRGYVKALRKAGIPWADCIAIYNCAEHSPDGATHAVRNLMHLKPRPTALLAMTDQLALAAIVSLKTMGLNVPNDVSVVGFDDIPEAGAATPRLTTVWQPLLDKGYWAAQMLLAHLRDAEPPNPGILPTRLVVRESTAVPSESAN